MATFIMTTRLSHEALASPRSFEQLSAAVSERIRTECPDVEWWSSYVVLGPTDYLDIFTAPDIETAAKVATIIRSYGHATTEIWPAVEWDAFKSIVRDMTDAPKGGALRDVP
jgi:uncharacterized protein with GYD domain